MLSSVVPVSLTIASLAGGLMSCPQAFSSGSSSPTFKILIDAFRSRWLLYPQFVQRNCLSESGISLIAPHLLQVFVVFLGFILMSCPPHVTAL